MSNGEWKEQSQVSDSVRISGLETDFEAPVVVPTEGSSGIDISKLLSETGYTTYDDGLANTASTMAFAMSKILKYSDCTTPQSENFRNGQRAISTAHQSGVGGR